MDSDSIAALMANLGVLGVLVWFLYYTVKYTLPDIQKEHTSIVQDINAKNASLVSEIVTHHRETIIDITNRFDNRLKEERNIWQSDLKEERVYRKEEIQQLTQAIESILKRLDK